MYNPEKLVRQICLRQTLMSKKKKRKKAAAPKEAELDGLVTTEVTQLGFSGFRFSLYIPTYFFQCLGVSQVLAVYLSSETTSLL